jgi:hypothetical protein
MTRLSDVRLSALTADSRRQLAGFTDQPTATLEVRGLELVSVLDELLARRRGDAGAAHALLDVAASSPDGHVRGRLRAIAEALLEVRS